MSDGKREQQQVPAPPAPPAPALVLPDAPALVVPERRLWALDRTMVTPATGRTQGRIDYRSGDGVLTIDGQVVAVLREWQLDVTMTSPAILAEFQRLRWQSTRPVSGTISGTWDKA